MNLFIKTTLAASCVLAGLISYCPLVQAKPEAVDKIVAVVNDDIITQSELNGQVHQVQVNLASQKVAAPALKVLRHQVLNHMIDEKVQLQIAEHNDITVDNATLDSAIGNIAKQNNLSLKELRKKLHKEKINYSNFRQEIQNEILIDKLQQQEVGKDITINENEVARAIKAQKNAGNAMPEYHVKNILISLPDTPTSREVQAAEKKANAIYKELKQGASFEKIALAKSNGEKALQGGDLGWRALTELPTVFADQIRNMKKNDISKPIRTGNGFHVIELAGIKNLSSNHILQETHARQIMLKVDDLVPSVTILAKIDELRSKLFKGEDFAKVAEQYSEDAGTAKQGGDMGWVATDMLQTPIANAIENLTPGEISTPIQAKGGWYLVEVLGRREVTDTAKYEHEKIQQMIYRRKLDEAIATWIQKIRGQAYIKILEG